MHQTWQILRRSLISTLTFIGGGAKPIGIRISSVSSMVLILTFMIWIRLWLCIRRRPPEVPCGFLFWSETFAFPILFPHDVNSQNEHPVHHFDNLLGP
jgi:hypothetical protein